MNLDFKYLFQMAKEKIESDLDHALILFALNYKANASAATTHNLGAFISKYGHECSYLKGHCKIAESLLKKSAEELNTASFSELGDLYLSEKRYKKAISMYNKAISRKPDFFDCANLAVCYYHEHKYGQTVDSLIRAHEFEIPEEFKYQTDILLAFSYVHCKEYEKAHRIFSKIIDTNGAEAEPDLLLLAYCLKDYKYIIDNYKYVFKVWEFSEDLFYTVYQAYVNTDRDNLDKYIKWVRAETEKFCRKNPMIDLSSFKNALDCADTSHEPNIFQYIPQPIWNVQFITEI